MRGDAELALQLRGFKLGVLLAPDFCRAAWSIRIGRQIRSGASATADCRRCRRRCVENLRVVTGGGRPEQLAALGERTSAHFGRMLADYFYCVAGIRGSGVHSASRVARAWSSLKRRRARGKGVMLVTAHLGNWELGGALLALRGLPMTVVTLEEPTSELTRWRDGFRRALWHQDDHRRAGARFCVRGNAADAAAQRDPRDARRPALRRDGRPVQFCGRETGVFLRAAPCSGSTPARRSCRRLCCSRATRATSPSPTRRCRYGGFRPAHCAAFQHSNLASITLKPSSASIPNSGSTTSPSGPPARSLRG